MTADPRARWAKQLAVPADAPADEVAAAFLRALPSDLVPTAEQVLAARGLIGTDLPTGLDNVPEEVLGAELEAFAARFWSLEPAERLLKWDELSRRGANQARLREFERGLDVTAPAFGDPVAEELAAQFRTLFVLPPRTRAIRRAQWLLARADGAPRWRSALMVVLRDAPALVALEPRLRTALESAFDPVAPAASGPRMSTRVDATGFTRQVRQGASTRDGTSRKALGVGVLLTIILVGKMIALSGRSDVPKSSYEPPRSVYENTNLQQAFRFTEADVTEYRVYELARDRGENVPVPMRYPAWVLAGKPLATFPNPGGTASVPNFTLDEIAECVVYEGERRNGHQARPPRTYRAWVEAGRPLAGLRDSEPGPREIRVTLDPDQILMCQQYDVSKRGPRPPQFDDWVKAGKPFAPGIFTVPRQPPSP